MPHITIAIPTHRRADLLRRALESTQCQTFAGEMEILVVENPSGDSTTQGPSFAQSLCLEGWGRRVRYFRNPSNIGMVGNWNRCLNLGQSPWIVILHDDDWLAPHHVELSLALAQANPDLRLVGCKAFIERQGAAPHPDRDPGSSVRSIRLAPLHFLLGNPFFASGVMIHRETALALGGFDADWYPTMDHLFWLQFCEAAPCAQIQLPLLHYYLGDNASLLPATLSKFIVNDWKQRSELLRRRFSRNPALSAYCRIKVHREQVFLQRFFDRQLSTQQLESNLTQVGWRPFPRPLRWIYFPIRIVLEAASRVLTTHLDPLPRASSRIA